MSIAEFADETFTEFQSAPVPEVLTAWLAVTSQPRAQLHFGQAGCFAFVAAHYFARLKQIRQDGPCLCLHHRNVDYEEALMKALERLPPLSSYLDMLGALCVCNYMSMCNSMCNYNCICNKMCMCNNSCLSNHSCVSNDMSVCNKMCVCNHIGQVHVRDIYNVYWYGAQLIVTANRQMLACRKPRCMDLTVSRVYCALQVDTSRCIQEVGHHLWSWSSWSCSSCACC